MEGKCYINTSCYSLFFIFFFSHTSLHLCMCHSFTLNAAKLYQFVWLCHIAFETVLNMLSFLSLFLALIVSGNRGPNSYFNVRICWPFNTYQIKYSEKHETWERNFYFSKDSCVFFLFHYQYFQFCEVFSHNLTLLKLLLGKHSVKDAVYKQIELNMKDRWFELCSYDVLGS